MGMYAIWIAWGNNYIEEGAKAAQGMKEHMPDVTTCLFTTSNFHEGFDRVGTVSSKRGNEPWYTTLVRWCYECLSLIPEGKKCLYFDTDVHIIAPVYDLYDLLDKYDIIATHAPARLTQPLTAMPTKIPDAFPELNIGVLGFNNNEAIKDLFCDWQFRQVSGRYGNNDQRSLRAALWESDASLYVFPPEYNFRFGFGGFLGRPAKVLHGRTRDLDTLTEQVTERIGMKSWIRGCLK
jgi:hypothetical protein